ncbi:MAG: hypothetical protein ACRC5B_07115, partial [Fusobacteriaceae bacterium]
KKLLTLFILISSIANANLKDGKYTCTSDKTIWFWYPYTEMTVENGEVVSASHDRIKKDGRKASLDEGYNKSMLKKNGVNPEIYSKVIPENYFKAEKDLEKMDGLAGATDSVKHFKKQMSLLLEKAETVGPGDYIIEKSQL